MSEDQARRIEAIEQRLARIEAHLGLVAPKPPIPNDIHAKPDDLPLASVAALPIETPPQPAPILPPPLPPQRPLVYARKEPPGLIAQSNLEQAIGLKWAGWIGAVVLVIGAGLGIKFAYEQGYFGTWPAELRLAMLALCGLALIGAGEYVLRRINPISAAAFFGSGVAILFLTSYAGHGYFDLYTHTTAFSLMVASTLIGSAVAMRGRLVSIAVLSLIGGNLAPLVLGEGVDDLRPFLAYLLMLQVVALFLAWWGQSGKWWMLRGLALVSTTLWTLAILDEPQQPMILGFCILAAGLYQLELILSATRTEGQEPNLTGTAFSMVVTFLLIAALLYLHHESSQAVRVAWVLGSAGVLGLVGLLLRRLHWLSISYRIQAAVLLVVAVPVYLQSAGIVVGWSALGVGFALLGSRLDLSISRRAAMATWLLSTFYLFLQAMDPSVDSEISRPVLEVWQTSIPLLLPLAVGVSMVGHLIAWVVNHRVSDEKVAREMRSSAQAIGMMAGAVWIGASLVALPPLGATLMIVLYGWVLALLHTTMNPPLSLMGQLVSVMLLAMVKWATVDMIGHRLSPAWNPSQYLPVVNPTMAMGVLIAASVGILGGLLRQDLQRLLRRDTGQSVAFPLACLMVAILTLGLTLEIDRMVERAAETIKWSGEQARFLAWTMLWSISTLLVGVVATRDTDSQRIHSRLVGVTVLLVLIAVKYFLADTVLIRLFRPPRELTVLLNLQAAAGLVLCGAILATILLARVLKPLGRGLLITLGCLGGLVLLWAGSMEIDRAAFWLGARGNIGSPSVASQMGLSVFWAIFAVVSVIMGFRMRLAGVRYFGLVLFGITLLKVVLIDLSHLEQGYRIISFLGVGLLLLGTSVLYGKLSPKLLAANPKAEETHA